MRFGEKMLILRRRRGLTLQQLADALGYVGTAYLSRVETGHKQPSLDLAIKLARLFDVSVDLLVRDEFDLPPPTNDEGRTTNDEGNVSGEAQ